MTEKTRRYRRKLRQYNVTFYLHEQKESDYFASLGVDEVGFQHYCVW